MLTPPEIRASDDDEGIGMVVAETVNLKTLAFALQRQIGYGPDHLRFALFTEDGWLHGEVSGTSPRAARSGRSSSAKRTKSC